jgi:hypothetical protein
MPSADAFVEAVRAEFLAKRRQAEGAIAQLDADARTVQLDAESNSVAMLMQHIAGNLRSRFGDFLTSDGEKPERDRDAEFVAGTLRGPALEEAWREGWETLLGALDGLRPEDLGRTVTIRGEAHTVPRALARSLAHTSEHVGQIVLLSKHLAGARWRTLSIPRGESRTWRPPRR